MKTPYSSPLRKFPLGAMAVMASVVGFGASVQAASVSVGSTFKTGSGNSTSRTLISVTPGSEGFSATDGGTLSESFNGAIEDYGFLRSNNITGAIDVDGGGSLLSFSAEAWQTFGGGYTHLWTTSTPDGSLSNPDETSIQTRGKNLVTSVDISGFSSGSVYLFYGVYNTTALFDVNLSGSGQTPVFYDDLVVSPSGANFQYMARFDFTDAADYETLDITMSMGNGKTGANRFAGAVVTNVSALIPEPSSALLGGLGALLLLRRRRN